MRLRQYSTTAPSMARLAGVQQAKSNAGTAGGRRQSRWGDGSCGTPESAARTGQGGRRERSSGGGRHRDGRYVEVEVEGMCRSRSMSMMSTHDTIDTTHHRTTPLLPPPVSPTCSLHSSSAAGTHDDTTGHDTTRHGSRQTANQQQLARGRSSAEQQLTRRRVAAAASPGRPSLAPRYRRCTPWVRGKGKCPHES